MLVFLNYIVDNPTQTDVIYLNIHKAFDSVSHGIMLDKLWSVGIIGGLWAWFKEYLTNRFQKYQLTTVFLILYL